MKSVWENTKTALILVDYSTLDELKKYREAIKNSGLNVNDCSFLAVVETKKERLALSQNTISNFICEKDINLLGKLKKNPEVTKLLGKSFDLILIVGDKPKKLRKLISKIKAKFITGLNCTKIEQNVNLKTKGETPSHLINFAKETLEKLV